MNQAIQVLDGCTYLDSKKAIKVDVMHAGQMQACFISGADKHSLIILYGDKQFEIEEIIELEFKQDNVNSNGEIWLTVEDVNTF